MRLGSGAGGELVPDVPVAFIEGDVPAAEGHKDSPQPPAGSGGRSAGQPQRLRCAGRGEEVDELVGAAGGELPWLM